MKLALIVPGGVDAGGEDRVIHSRLWLIERLATRHEVHVFALGQNDAPGDWPLLGAMVHDTGRARGRRRRLWRAFRAEHARARFDVVHAFFGWCGAHAGALGARFGVPMVFHASGGEFVAMPEIEYGMRSTLRGRAGLKFATSRAARVTVATPSMQRLADDCGIRAECVPIGVALDRWPAGAVRARDRGEAARLLHIGDIRAVKDQTTLLRAARLLRNRDVAFRLDLAGFDTTASGIAAELTRFGLADRVRYHGVLRRPALRALVDRTDLLLITSRHEAGPLAVLEAAVAGVPTVGTAVGHIDEWSPHAAVAVPVGSSVALADEVQSLLGDEERRQRIAAAAQARAIAIDADFTARRFEEIYAGMMRAR